MTVFSFADFDQHEQVIFGHDTESGLRAIIAIHNTNLRPALGGCRMYPYPSEAFALRDVLRLSRGMTYKSALAELPLGGGKSVIIGDPSKHKTDALFQAMGRLVEGLSGQYILAQDSGTTVQDLNIIASQTKHVAGIHDSLDACGQTHTGDPSPATAYGVFVGIKAAVKHKLGCDDLAGIQVAIQGVGNVGFGLAQHLSAEGAKLYVYDVNPVNVARAVERCGAEAVSADQIYSLAVDVFAPCALGGAVNKTTVKAIKASIVAGAANNQLETPGLGDALHQAGILYVPDYVINAGGIIHIYSMREQKTWEESMRHVERIGFTLAEIFKRSEASGETTATVADRLAEERFKPALRKTSQAAVA